MYKLRNGFKKWEVISLIEQFNNGERSFNAFADQCVYETDDGNHCAVGCFIPDGHPGMKSLDAVRELLDLYPDLKECMPLSIVGMTALQEVHDVHHKEVLDVKTRMINWVKANVKENKT